MEIELLTLFGKRIPNLYTLIPRDPDFVSEIAGVTSARDVDWHSRNLPARDAEIFQVGDVCFRNRFQQLRRCGALQGEGSHLLRNVFDLYVHIQAVLTEPAQAGVGGGPAIDVFLETRNRAVVDHLPFLIAPAAVNNLPDFDLIDVACDHAVHQAGRILAGDQVLVEWGNVDQRA